MHLLPSPALRPAGEGKLLFSHRHREHPLLAIRSGGAQELLADICEVPLMDHGVLGRDVKVAHPPLQRRAVIDRAAARDRKAPTIIEIDEKNYVAGYAG